MSTECRLLCSGSEEKRHVRYSVQSITSLIDSKYIWKLVRKMVGLQGYAAVYVRGDGRWYHCQTQQLLLLGIKTKLHVCIKWAKWSESVVEMLSLLIASVTDNHMGRAALSFGFVASCHWVWKSVVVVFPSMCVKWEWRVGVETDDLWPELRLH